MLIAENGQDNKVGGQTKRTPIQSSPKVIFKTTLTLNDFFLIANREGSKEQATLQI